MMTAIIFDIETIPDGRLIQKIHYPQEKNQQPLTPQEAIQKYQEELIEQSKKQKKQDFFLPYVYHVPISAALIRVDPKGYIQNMTTLDRNAFRPYQITEDFWKIWKKYNPSHETPTPFVTFNGRGFDLPVMELCAYRYGISIPDWFATERPTYSQPRYRYTTKYHIDLMELLTNFGANYFHGGLNLAASLLGKPGKMNVQGSNVLSLWQEGKQIEIDDYCLCDALDTYFVYLRTMVMKGNISIEEEDVVVKKAHSFLQQNISTYPILQTYLDNFHFWEAPNEVNKGFLI